MRGTARSSWWNGGVLVMPRWYICVYTRIYNSAGETGELRRGDTGLLKVYGAMVHNRLGASRFVPVSYTWYLLHSLGNGV